MTTPSTLDTLFRPTSVAAVGASERVGSVGHGLIQNLLDGSFTGKVYPVNPKHDTLLGVPCFPNLAAIGQPVDLVVVATPLKYAPQTIRDCAAVGCHTAVVLSAGGKEAGEEGKAIEEELVRAARESGVRVLGPNCLGIQVPGVGLNASFASHMAPTGRVAFLSQSGALCTAILDQAMVSQTGFSHFVSVGSQADLSFGDLIDTLGATEEVESIILYIESLTDVARFMSAARAVSKIKPILAVKSGRSASGAKAAASHTGAMAGSDTVFDAALARAGVIRVDTVAQLFDCAKALAKQPRPTGGRVAVLTNAGGPGVMAADALERLGERPVSLSSSTVAALNACLPPYWSHNNPVDVLGDATPERYAAGLKVLLAAEECDAVIAILTPQSMTDPQGIAAALVEASQGSKRPVMAVWMGGLDVGPGRQTLEAGGVPCFETPEQAVEVVMAMVRYSRNLAALQATPQGFGAPLRSDTRQAAALIRTELERHPDGLVLSEIESKALLASYGVPVNATEAAHTVQAAVQTAAEFGYPVAMKLLSPTITHKSDAGGVQLNLRGEEDVRRAYAAIQANALAYGGEGSFWGVTVQPMLPRPDFELILGGRQDPSFGPVLLFGMGGILTEILEDTALELAPLNRHLAGRMIERTRVAKLLGGYRNRPAADRAALEEILVRLSDLMADFPEITELDINPLLIHEGRPVAVDARVALAPTCQSAPRHMVIRPYPKELEEGWVLQEGTPVLIRPVVPEDEPMLVHMLEQAREQEGLFHYFDQAGPKLHEAMAKLVQNDYDREIGLVAVEQPPGKPRILGIVRILQDPIRPTQADFALAVAAGWQGQGLGRKLLAKGIEVAKGRGIERLGGRINASNQRMRGLAESMGFGCEEGDGVAWLGLGGKL